MRSFLLAVPVLLGAVPMAGAAGSASSLVLTAAQIAAGRIETAALAAVQRTATVPAFGQVLDPGTLAAAAAKIASARAAVAQAKAKLTLAQAEETRAAALFHAERNISKAQYQTAEANAQVVAADLNVAEAQLRSDQAQLRAEWGEPLASAIGGGKTPVPELVSGTACLVRLTLPFGAALASAPQQAQAEPPAGPTLELRLIGPSPRSPTGRGPSYFYLGSGSGCPPVGMAVEAALPTGPKRDGVLVPTSAVVWRGGEPLAYRDEGKDGFAPVPLDAALPAVGGYFVPASADSPLRAGQKIVVKGAGLLLSQSEMPAEPKQAGGDDDDD